MIGVEEPRLLGVPILQDLLTLDPLCAVIGGVNCYRSNWKWCVNVNQRDIQFPLSAKGAYIYQSTPRVRIRFLPQLA